MNKETFVHEGAANTELEERKTSTQRHTGTYAGITFEAVGDWYAGETPEFCSSAIYLPGSDVDLFWVLSVKAITCIDDSITA